MRQIIAAKKFKTPWTENIGKKKRFEYMYSEK